MTSKPANLETAPSFHPPQDLAAANPGGGRPAHAPALAPLRPEHRPAVESVLRDARVFRDAEIVIALEVLDAYLQRPGQDYAALGAFTQGGDLLGFICFGPTPCTIGTWDVYWIAVAPAAQNAGVGTLLLEEVEGRLARTDARLVVIETSSLPMYDPTRAFYLRRGYAEVARVPDFYADGDDRVIFAKRLHPKSHGER